ncbi:MAG: hypothetical protein M3390_10885, partial [Chloroflexota bacterium]|nr:hypothetical protein [Chloroflexota bacterium]
MVNNPQHVLNVNGNVQGVVQGQGNTVTLVSNNGVEQAIPFLAPPLPPHELSGRGAQLHRLKQLLLAQKGRRAVAITGKAGIGKGALATTLAWEQDVLAHFSGGVLWAGSFAGPGRGTRSLGTRTWCRRYGPADNRRS